MKKSFLLLAGASVLALGAMLTPAMAADFEFDADVQGDGELAWNFELQETEHMSEQNGAEFSFNGGAGTDGNANAYGDLTGVGGFFYEAAGGDGDAYSHTNGTNWATASFGSESYSINGGFAADVEFGGDPAKIKYSGLATGGGAGSVQTGLTTGFEYDYTNTGAAGYDVDADLSGSLDLTP